MLESILKLLLWMNNDTKLLLNYLCYSWSQGTPLLHDEIIFRWLIALVKSWCEIYIGWLYLLDSKNPLQREWHHWRQQPLNVDINFIQRPRTDRYRLPLAWRLVVEQNESSNPTFCIKEDWGGLMHSINILVVLTLLYLQVDV